VLECCQVIASPAPLVVEALHIALGEEAQAIQKGWRSSQSKMAKKK
jgi:hypothetical protein